FESVAAENQQMCSDTGAIVRESIDIVSEIYDPHTGLGMGPEWDGIRQDLLRLGQQQNRSSWARRGFGVIAGFLFCALGDVRYCGGVASQLFGGELESTVHDRAENLNRRQSDLNARQAQLQLRAELVTMHANIVWAQEIQPECLVGFPDATLGP